MPDISQLFQYAPSLAASMVGQNQALDASYRQNQIRELTQLIQQREQQAQQQQAMNPLLMEHQRLVNQGLQAGLPGITASAEAAQLANQRTRGTLSSDIEATNSINSGKVLEQKAKTAERAAKAFQNMGPFLTGTPADSAIATQHMEAQGLDPKSSGGQLIMNVINNTPPGQLRARIAEISQNLTQQSEKYIEEMSKQRLANEGHLAVAKQQGANQIAVTKAQIDAGKYAKKELSNDLDTQVNQLLLSAKGDPDKQYAILNRAAVIAAQNQDMATALKYQQQAASLEPQVQARAAARANPQAGGVNTGGLTGLPTNPQLNVTPPPLPGTETTTSPLTQGGAQRVRVQRPDGKIGTIPADQLDQALKQGYKRAQ